MNLNLTEIIFILDRSGSMAGLEADLDEMEALLCEAGYALSGSETFDLIIRYCVEHRVFDLDEINEALDSFQLKPLGGVA